MTKNNKPDAAKITFFQNHLLRWFKKNGRKDLPWQQNKTAYSVWVSEIMLQQTQVVTVLPYYLRFMERFTDLPILANASLDEVLHYWTGLGYYSRARNLHRTAQMICTKLPYHFPDTLEELVKLPGIGHSTAGAILSLAFGKATTILDGNVKRVLARFHAITSPINDKVTEQVLWSFATAYTPHQSAADYTQAIMDLGALICTPRKPLCLQCPLGSKCLAYEFGLSDSLPIKKTVKKLPVRVATFFIFKKSSHILLEKRPEKGIWGGLWSFPQMAGKLTAEDIEAYLVQHFNIIMQEYTVLKTFRHTFTHYHLDIHPIVVQIKSGCRKKLPKCTQIWYNLKKPQAIGLPQPVQTLMRKIA